MKRRSLPLVLAFGLLSVTQADAQSDEELIKNATSAAPEAVGPDATVIEALSHGHASAKARPTAGRLSSRLALVVSCRPQAAIAVATRFASSL